MKACDGRLADAYEAEGPYPRQRQEFEPLYLRNGAIYAARSSVIANGRLWGARCLAYLMPEERSLNINTAFQFRIAELFIMSGAGYTHDASHEAVPDGQ